MAKSIALALLHQGLVRRHNEDNLYILDGYVQAAQSLNFEKSAVSSGRLQLYAVADGIGGGGIGDAASRTVMRVLDQQRRNLRASRFDFESFARETVNLANRSVCEQLAAYEGLNVGTTFSLLAIEQDTAYTISLGSSRIYLYRDNQLRRLTEDHISRMPDHHQMTRNLGFLTDAAVLGTENMTQTVLSRGDILLLVTDGITNSLDDAQIAGELGEPAAFIQTIRRLRDLALQAGGRDNIALIAVKIQDPKASDTPRRQKKNRHLSDRFAGWLGSRRARAMTAENAYRPKAPEKQGRSYYGPTVKGHAGIGQNGPAPRWLRPFLFFLLFVILGIILGRILFSMPAIFGRLLSFILY